MSERRKRVVILGGGFAGVYTAQYLERALGRRDDFEILLINRENYFVFQPMLPEVISGSIGITTRSARFAGCFPGQTSTCAMSSRLISIIRQSQQAPVFALTCT